VSLIAALVSYGLQSTHAKIKDLLETLVCVLDGRSDLEAQGKPFAPRSARFKLTPVSPAVTSLKVQVVKILTEVANLRANFRLAKLLTKFQEYNEDPRLALDLKKLHSYVAENKVRSTLVHLQR
jgi:hypothetical protein